MTPSFLISFPNAAIPPDLERFVAALLAFTLARMEAEEREAEKKQSEDSDD